MRHREKYHEKCRSLIWDFVDVADGLADIDEVGYDAE